MKLNLLKGKPTQNMQYLTILISLMLISCCIQMKMNSQKMKQKEKVTSNNEALPFDFNDKTTQMEKSTQSKDNISSLSLLELSQKSKKTTKRIKLGKNKILKKSDFTNRFCHFIYTTWNEGLENNKFFKFAYNCGSDCRFDGE